MNFFVDIEPLDIYVKPQYRAKTMAILDYFWTQPDYRAAIVGFASTTATGEDTNPRFVRFVNMLINDSIYAMNEALTKLKAIKDIQAEMETEAWNAQPARTRQVAALVARRDRCAVLGILLGKLRSKHRRRKLSCLFLILGPFQFCKICQIGQ